MDGRFLGATAYVGCLNVIKHVRDAILRINAYGKLF